MSLKHKFWKPIREQRWQLNVNLIHHTLLFSYDRPCVSTHVHSFSTMYTYMTLHTRLLSNNNDSDLLEISGIRSASPKQYSALSGAPRLADWTGRWNKAHVHKTHPHITSRKCIKHIFALEETRGDNISPASSQCSTLSPHPLNVRAVYWYSAAQVSKKAKPFKHLNRCLFCL